MTSPDVLTRPRRPWPASVLLGFGRPRWSHNVPQASRVDGRPAYRGGHLPVAAVLGGPSAIGCLAGAVGLPADVSVIAGVAAAIVLLGGVLTVRPAHTVSQDEMAAACGDYSH